jgi:hypothetical protein
MYMCVVDLQDALPLHTLAWPESSRYLEHDLCRRLSCGGLSRSVACAVVLLYLIRTVTGGCRQPCLCVQAGGCVHYTVTASVWCISALHQTWTSSVLVGAQSGQGVLTTRDRPPWPVTGA